MRCAVSEHAQGLSPNPKPSNVTTLAGIKAVFSCGPAQAGAPVTWSMQSVNRTVDFVHEKVVVGEKELFKINPTSQQPVYAPGVSSAKYGVVNKYYLVVQNVDIKDAAPYFCSSPNASDVTNRAYANLVVIGAFTHAMLHLLTCAVFTRARVG